ncbi:ca[2+]-channel protein alpha[[1]] subunit T [Brevipalpus obovatus]|uniref:ca[2+]-channel protein alpha[[1]] subunit T n=1 Tax=Brevipalpus obovatus TaxID=246614 RepID=UPI003D9F15AF
MDLESHSSPSSCSQKFMDIKNQPYHHTTATTPQESTHQSSFSQSTRVTQNSFIPPPIPRQRHRSSSPNIFNYHLINSSSLPATTDFTSVQRPTSTLGSLAFWPGLRFADEEESGEEGGETEENCDLTVGKGQSRPWLIDEKLNRISTEHSSTSHLVGNPSIRPDIMINTTERRISIDRLENSNRGFSSAASDGSGRPTSKRNSISNNRISPSNVEDSRINPDLPYPEYTELSFNCLPQTSLIRQICITMISNPWFERVSMMAILLNCITLGMYQPCVDDICTRNQCKILQVFDDMIFLFFAAEMFIKMTAMGIRGTRGAYLSETWNRLDFFIVIAGVLEYINLVGDINLSAIRTVRVLRPLRAINRIPSMRILVMLLLDTLPMLGNVLLLCFFVFFIFGIIGVQLWAGILRQRCFIELPENVTLPKSENFSEYFIEHIKNGDPIASHYQMMTDTEKDYICSMDKDNGMHKCDNLPPYKMGDRECTGEASPFNDNQPNETWCVNWNRYYTKCAHGDENPFQGAMSFDNVGMAWTAIFLVISLEGWTEIMYYVQDAHSFWDWTYFVLLIVIGSFFMINLCLVVIATQFSETKKREMERMRQERARSTSSFGSNSASEPADCYDAIIKYLAHMGRQAKRKIFRWYRQYRSHRRRQKDSIQHNRTNDNRKSVPYDPESIHETSNLVSGGTGKQVGLERNAALTCGVHESGIRFRCHSRKNKTSQHHYHTHHHHHHHHQHKHCHHHFHHHHHVHLSPRNENSRHHRSCSKSGKSRSGSGDQYNLGPSCFPMYKNELDPEIMIKGSEDNPKVQEIKKMSELSPQKLGMIVPYHPEANTTPIDSKNLAKNLSSDTKNRSTLSPISPNAMRSSKSSIEIKIDPDYSRPGHSPPMDMSLHPSSPLQTMIGCSSGQRSTRSDSNSRNTNSNHNHNHNNNNRHSENICYIMRDDASSNSICKLIVGQRSVTIGNHMPVYSSSSGHYRPTSRHCSAPTLVYRRNSSPRSINDADIKQPLLPLTSTIRSPTSVPIASKTDLMVPMDSNPMVIPVDHQHKAHSRSGSNSNVDTNDLAKNCCSENVSVCIDSGGKNCDGCADSNCSWTEGSSDESSDSDDDDICLCDNSCCHCVSWFRSVLQIVVNHRYFQRFIFLAILFNTLSMGIEYHNQPIELTHALELSNLIFTFLFGIEMILKLLAEGCFRYISDGFNVFDGIVVIVSIMELMEESGSGLSVLRTFRLLRILKLVRFMPALKRQLVIMLKTLDNVAVFFALLVLFIFIFSILGMNLFGCKFCDTMPDNTTRCDRKNFDSLLWALVTVFQFCTHPNGKACTCDELLMPEYSSDCVCDRKNFSNFLWALVTVFQILTQEDWNVVLFNGMERTTHWAALYFVVLMTFGNYVLFNLLVAILVEGFSQEKDDDKKDPLEDGSDEEEDQVKDGKLIYFYHSKDNLEQELRLLSNPPGAASGSFTGKLEAASAALDSSSNEDGVNIEPHGPSTWILPPRIIHTAATPQGSPRALVTMSSLSSKSGGGDKGLGGIVKRYEGKGLTLSSYHSTSMVNIDQSGTDQETVEEVEMKSRRELSQFADQIITNLTHLVPSLATFRLHSPCPTPHLARGNSQRSVTSRKSALSSSGGSGSLSGQSANQSNYNPGGSNPNNNNKPGDTSIRSRTGSGGSSNRVVLITHATGHDSSVIGGKNDPQGGEATKLSHTIWQKRSSISASASVVKSGRRKSCAVPFESVIKSTEYKLTRNKPSIRHINKDQHNGCRILSVDNNNTSSSTVQHHENSSPSSYRSSSNQQYHHHQQRFVPSNGSESKRNHFDQQPSTFTSNSPMSSMSTTAGNHQQHCNGSTFMSESSTIAGNESGVLKSGSGHEIDGSARVTSSCNQGSSDFDTTTTMFTARKASITTEPSMSTITTTATLPPPPPLPTPSPTSKSDVIVFPLSAPPRAGPNYSYQHQPLSPRTSFSIKSPNESGSTPSPSFYTGDKRYSLIHEIKAVSPGKSLGGVFYCSSIVARKNSSESSNPINQGNQRSRESSATSARQQPTHEPFLRIVSPKPSANDCRKRKQSMIGNQIDHPTVHLITDGSENNGNDNGNVDGINVNDIVQPKRKFCAYFKWYDWMSKRDDCSLFIFPPDNRIRFNCIYMTEHKCFDYVILIFISLNCVTLAMERSKIPPWSFEREFLTAANYVFTVVFAIEMALKVIANGLWYGEKAYFTSGWNVMDGILVGVSLFDLVLSLFAQKSPRIFGILRVFRLLRSLRPLRVINRAPGLKLVVQTLLSSLRPIGNIVLICCTFFIIFGILGVQLFKGALFYCEGQDVRNVRNRTDCLSDPRNKWVNRKYNFDNLGQALMALFVLSSKDGWVNIMYTGLDAVGVDQQPRENYNEWRLIYFISFLLLVAFFVLNMFVGVVVENFHRCREEQEKEERALRAEKRARKLEKRRRNRVQTQSMIDLIETSKPFRNYLDGPEYYETGMREPPYYIGYDKFRLSVHKLVTGKYFDVIIAAVIGLNVVTMSLEYYRMPEELEYSLKVFNFVFTAVFVVEAIMKLYALGVQRYLKDKWNQLDVMIVILSICGIILEEMESELIPINPTIIRVMRVARIARVLKLLKMAKGMRALLNTVMQALPQVGNLGLLFFLLFFIFAALGVELFGRLECDDDHPCQGLSEHAHFQNFGMAFLTLFRVATGDNWNGVMKDTLRDQCDPSRDCLRNCCVSPVIAPMYFVIFVLLAQFVLVNVVVAVLMKHLEESHKHMEEDEDYEIDMEIARELAAEKKALEDAIERRKREEELRRRKSNLYRVASLPDNFSFHFSGDSDSSQTAQVHRILEYWQHVGHSMDSGETFAKISQQERPIITVDHPADPSHVGDGQSLVNTNHQSHHLDAAIATTAGQSNDQRKLSDITIVDEDSTQLSQFLLPAYPELSRESEVASEDSLSWCGDEVPSESLASISSDSLSLKTDIKGCLHESQL